MGFPCNELDHAAMDTPWGSGIWKMTHVHITLLHVEDSIWVLEGHMWPWVIPFKLAGWTWDHMIWSQALHNQLSVSNLYPGWWHFFANDCSSSLVCCSTKSLMDPVSLETLHSLYNDLESLSQSATVLPHNDPEAIQRILSMLGEFSAVFQDVSYSFRVIMQQLMAALLAESASLKRRQNYNSSGQHCYTSGGSYLEYAGCWGC